MVNLACPDYVALRHEELSAWLHAKYKAMANAMVAAIAQYKEAAETLTGTLGSF
jgi:hypothetical protein